MTTTKLAFQLLAASNYIDALGGVSQSYRQALASYEAQAEAEAKPAPPFTPEERKALEKWVAAAPAAPAPAGFVLVPVEPTPEMLKRFDGFEFRAPFDPKHAALREGLWRSILNAAPAAPAPATELSDDELDALIPQWRHTTAAANEVCWQRRDVRQAMRAAIAASKGEQA